MYNNGNPNYYTSPYDSFSSYYFQEPYNLSYRQIDLGTRWEVEEGGFRGVWTRRGNSNVFDARWTRPGATPITAVLRMRLQDNFVCISRRNSSDGNNCQYVGRIEGRRVTGFNICNRGGGPWSGTIIRGPRVPDLGTRWDEEEDGWRGVWTRRGNSNVFDARWTRPGATPVTAVLRMQLQDNNVRIERRNSSDGNDCDYTGRIEGRRATGTYSCDQGGGTWSATIT
ncbi:hypothetical protein WQ54_17170 [Bacillus sp. SA1-12]|uniref:hypothetical protein n=1 Tax=Bacillus sp. SA1-12 TaxID=1455638 RepID=UPI0006272A16|nr:hypothetical protein [Bacillus sp. SA1-12]KKI91025.1 hypothetical protein WQ54_17170 [Bacillus sp. SA1-12]